uniref:Uncharacterized protein n=1 Tax=Glossina brevipalpis TaxID=37001 RepID=A0A1A9WN13_9MUSC
MRMLKIDPMIDDDAGLKGSISMDSPDSCLTRSLNNSPTPFASKSISMLRNYRQNPMIGGPGMLASPTLTINTNCQVTRPALTIVTDDVAHDSGIDDISMNEEGLSPLKDTFDLKSISDTYSDTTNIMLNPIKEYEKSLVTVVKNELSPLAMLNGQQPPPLENTMDFKEDNDRNTRNVIHNNEDNLDKNKSSISLIDNNNPLMSPFLMDLCSDDYDMNTDDYLKGSDIEIVLNEWPTELI